MAGRISAKRNFNVIHAVHRGISGGSSTEDLDAGSRKETEVREVMTYLFRKVDGIDDSGIVNASVAQKSHLRFRHIRPT